MRLIEFRAWDKTQEIMRTIEELDFRNKDVCLSMSVGEQGKFYYTNISNVEIMQKLSLKDFDGNHIYEGDILEKVAFNGQEYMLEGVVVWDCDGFSLKTTQHHDQSKIGGIYSLPYAKQRQIDMPKVIGNIYENPELLKIRKVN